MFLNNIREIYFLHITRLFCFVCVLLIVGGECVYAADGDINPTPHNVVLSVKMDKASLPPSIVIFNNEFAGKSKRSNTANSSLFRYARNNTLTCLSKTDTSQGACPVNPYWGNGIEGPLTWGNLILRFTQQETGRTVDLTLDGIRKRPPKADVSLWNATSNFGENPITMSISIPRSELTKLSPGKPWKAHLSMNLTQWISQCSGFGSYGNPSIGCPGSTFVTWNADISIKVTDYGTQKIYFPEYSASNPLIDLGLNIVGKLSSATANAAKNIDMCLYDGNNSDSSQISLLFRDEGKTAVGRKEGDFSIYSLNGGTDTSNRMDYNISIVNPKTGAPQRVINGQEIIWTGVSASQGNVKVRLVKLPGVSGLVQCVPAPLTLSIPQFRVSSKSPGRYLGRLSIIYTPTTQSWIDEVIN